MQIEVSQLFYNSVFTVCHSIGVLGLRISRSQLHFAGLYDTVFDVDNDKQRAHAQGLEPNGFCFDGADPSGVDYALNRQVTNLGPLYCRIFTLQYVIIIMNFKMDD